MKMYTPEQALRVARFRQTAHNAASVLLGTGAFVSAVAVIGLAEGSGNWIQLAAAIVGTAGFAIAAWAADAGRYYWEKIEKEIIKRHGVKTDE